MAFVPRAKLTNKEAHILAHSVNDWLDNIELKSVWHFLGGAVFGEAAMYSGNPLDSIRSASIVAIEDSLAISISKDEYLVRELFDNLN
jgi:CRP-like cAMP-binding protein